MNSVSAHPALIAKAPIRAWRIAGGAFLHFAVPAYVVTVAVATLFTAPTGAPLGDLARLALGYSGWFLAGYAALALAATLAAAAMEPLVGIRRRRRDAIDPSRAAIDSRRRVARALADARSLPGAELRRLADALASPRWDHDDERACDCGWRLGRCELRWYRRPSGEKQKNRHCRSENVARAS